jgi:hypothetical protein
MTDDELQQRLRRLAAPHGTEPDWDAMAADVHAAYEREVAGGGASVTPLRRGRRSRWIAAPLAGALAIAAAFALYVKHTQPPPASVEPIDAVQVFEDPEPGEMIEEMTPAELDRLAKAFNKGA